MNYDLLEQDLWRDESFRPQPYDDATGQSLKAGMTIHGTVSWGVGFTNITDAEGRAVLSIRLPVMWSALAARLPWISTLSDPRQRALANMAYNLGVSGLLTFTTFLGLLQSGQFDAAADDLMTTPWATQVGQRAARIAALIREPSPLIA